MSLSFGNRQEELTHPSSGWYPILMEEANLHGFVANCLGLCPLHGVCHFGWNKQNCEDGASSQRWRSLPRTDGKTSRDCSLKKKKIK